MSEWQPIETAPLDTAVLTKIHDSNGCRNETELVKKKTAPECRSMWWFSDMSMYVYYEPTHWKHVEPPNGD